MALGFCVCCSVPLRALLVCSACPFSAVSCLTLHHKIQASVWGFPGRPLSWNSEALLPRIFIWEVGHLFIR